MAFGEPSRTACLCERLLLEITGRPRYRAQWSTGAEVLKGMKHC